MTSTELKKEMEIAGFSVIKKIHLILTVIAFFVTMGMGIGVSQAQLATKIDEPKARQIVKEELKESLVHYGTDVDVKVLQSKLEALEKKLDELNHKLDKVIK